jgi:hypothetical protein
MTPLPPLSQQHARQQKDLKYENEKKRRQREFQKLEYNVFHMQLWAKEGHERDNRLQAEQQQRYQQEKLLREAQEKEQRKLQALQEDVQNLKYDVHETQLLRQTMRKCGVRSGVNAATHLLPPPVVYETTRFLTFKLRDNVNLDWKLKHQRTPDILMPFDVDLKLYRDVETLRGVNLGERGALALAGEFVRGACSNLITLDLSRYPPPPPPSLPVPADPSADAKSTAVASGECCMDCGWDESSIFNL